jgi:hypothetical protein
MEVTKTETIEVVQTIVNSEQIAQSKNEEHNSSQLNGDSYITAESSTSSAHNVQESKDTDFMEVDEVSIKYILLTYF